MLCVCFISINSNAFAWEKVKLYAEAEAGYSFMKMKSGGLNAYPFLNTGSDEDGLLFPGLHFGARFFDIFRADISYSYRGKADFTTNSFVPPIPPTFFYDTEIKNIQSLIFSVFVEPFTFKGLTPYIGAGVGSTWMKVETNDGVVMADSRETKFTWQAEAGLYYAFTNNLGMRVGYRYVDMGKFDVDLRLMGIGAPYGNLTGKLTAHELTAAFRYTF